MTLIMELLYVRSATGNDTERRYRHEGAFDNRRLYPAKPQTHRKQNNEKTAFIFKGLGMVVAKGTARTIQRA